MDDNVFVGPTGDSGSQPLEKPQDVADASFDIAATFSMLLHSLTRMVERYGWLIIIGGFILYMVYQQVARYLKDRSYRLAPEEQQARAERLREVRRRQQEEWDKAKSDVYKDEEKKARVERLRKAKLKYDENGKRRNKNAPPEGAWWMEGYKSAGTKNYDARSEPRFGAIQRPGGRRGG